MSKRYGKTPLRRKRQRVERKSRKKLVEQVQRELQLKFDKDEVLALLQGSLDVVAVELGRRVVVQFLEHDVEQLCGPRYQRPSDPGAPGRATDISPVSCAWAVRSSRSTDRGFVPRGPTKAKCRCRSTTSCSSPRRCRRHSCGAWCVACSAATTRAWSISPPIVSG